MRYEDNTREKPEKDVNNNAGHTPEIDTSRFQSGATNVIPDEVPRRDGPGGN